MKLSPHVVISTSNLHQVLTAHLLTPTVYALLPNKSQNTYVSLLNQLKKIKPTLSPKSIMSDFEMGSTNAFKEVFPNLKQKGCHFHFSQYIWRKILQIEYMARKYISDFTFSLQVRLLLALAYVPENHVIDVFEELIDSQYFTDNDNNRTFYDH
jgi:hypothetical protein